MLRSHTCGELRAEHVGQEVTLGGWVDTYRDHKGVLFIDLRDRYGKTQVVFAPESGEEAVAIGRSLRSEDVVSVTGAVAHRPEDTANPEMATGQIEVRVRQVKVLNKSKLPPMKPSTKEQLSEDLR
ncbi:MAG: OB-fold nucleic acid binding domain-containing protein, partial [Thermoguttaceae bacterium]